MNKQINKQVNKWVNSICKRNDMFYRSLLNYRISLRVSIRSTNIMKMSKNCKVLVIIKSVSKSYLI